MMTSLYWRPRWSGIWLIGSSQCRVANGLLGNDMGVELDCGGRHDLVQTSRHSGAVIHRRFHICIDVWPVSADIR